MLFLWPVLESKVLLFVCPFLGFLLGFLFDSAPHTSASL